MRRFTGEQTAALRTAAGLGVRIAVIHPIVRHGSRQSLAGGTGEDAWLRENIACLTPLRELVKKGSYDKSMPTRLERAALGNDAGVVGAALLCDMI